MGSIKVPYDELRRRIIEMDEEALTVQMLEQLIRYMPSHEAIQQLAAFKDEYDDMAEPEQFSVKVGIPRKLLEY